MFRRISTRRQVRRRLEKRNCGDFLLEWDKTYTHSTVKRQVADFVRDAFCAYASIDQRMVRPDDMLGADLGFPATAYPDWELDLAEEFQRVFKRPLPLKDIPPDLHTLNDWVEFLYRTTQKGSSN